MWHDDHAVIFSDFAVAMHADLTCRLGLSGRAIMRALAPAESL
jgi:hypothetical protein